MKTFFVKFLLNGENAKRENEFGSIIIDVPSDFNTNIFEQICYRDICGIYGEDSVVTYLHIQELNETKNSIVSRGERKIICNALREYADNHEDLRSITDDIKIYFK